MAIPVYGLSACSSGGYVHLAEMDSCIVSRTQSQFGDQNFDRFGTVGMVDYIDVLYWYWTGQIQPTAEDVRVLGWWYYKLVST